MIPQQGKKVAVLGLRETGFLSAIDLYQRGYQVFGSDLSDEEEILRHVEKLTALGIEAECGKHSLEKIVGVDWVLISPGIPPQSSVYRALRAASKPIYSEIEVASWFSQAKKVIAVTGSCGKTTTATLLAKVLEACGQKTILCGNIGNPWIGELPKITNHTVVVLELSSFQLMHCCGFSPSVGLLLNVYPNHQDWHADMNEYVQAKLNLFRSMKSDGIMICRKEDERRYFPDFQTKASRVYLDSDLSANPNEMALWCAADALGCDRRLVSQVLQNFQGLEHRLEKFASGQGICFVNDSKSTTPASLVWALQKFPDQSVILIAGGKAKSKDFGNLSALVLQKVKCAILIGEAREMIAAAWAGQTEIVKAEDFNSACSLALNQAMAGNVVLLSPACASFDMFRNYQERGHLFKEKIRGLLDQKKSGIPTLIKD